MGRKPTPEDEKKVRVSFVLDRDVYLGIKDLRSMADWIRVACRMRFDAEKKAKKKGKNG